MIRASEIGQHAFSARSWWLGRVKGYRSAHIREMADGTAAHQTHARWAMRYSRLHRPACALLILAGLVDAVRLYLSVQAGS